MCDTLPESNSSETLACFMYFCSAARCFKDFYMSMQHVVFQLVVCWTSLGTWGMKRAGANEDTSSLPVMPVLDPEPTYLQKVHPCVAD